MMRMLANENMEAWKTDFSVSVETVRTSPRATSSSHSRLKVQWQRPSGGSLQASWINFCSMSPLILILSGRGGWGRWSRAAWNPSVTRRLRTRSTVRRLVPRAVTMSSSPCPWPWELSASSRMRAWASLRAAPWPTETRCSNWVRSSAVKVTRYFSMVDLLLLRGGRGSNPQETGPCFSRQSKIGGILVVQRNGQDLVAQSAFRTLTGRFFTPAPSPSRGGA